MASDIIYDIPTALSTDGVWLSWYAEVKKAVGKHQAVVLFKKAWNKRGIKADGTASLANTPNLRSEMEKEGVTVAGTGFFSDLGDLGSSVGDGIGDFFTGIKWITIISSVVILGVIGYAIYKAIQNPKGTAKLVASVTPAGRAATVAKAVAKGGGK